MSDGHNARILDSSVTHLFISEQVLLEYWDAGHDWSEIVSPTQFVESALPFSTARIIAEDGTWQHNDYIAHHIS